MKNTIRNIYNAILDNKLIILFHPESAGIKVSVIRNRFKRMLLPKDFATLKEVTLYKSGVVRPTKIEFYNMETNTILGDCDSDTGGKYFVMDNYVYVEDKCTIDPETWQGVGFENFIIHCPTINWRFK